MTAPEMLAYATKPFFFELSILYNNPYELF